MNICAEALLVSRLMITYRRSDSWCQELYTNQVMKVKLGNTRPRVHRMLGKS